MGYSHPWLKQPSCRDAHPRAESRPADLIPGSIPQLRQPAHAPAPLPAPRCHPPGSKALHSSLKASLPPTTSGRLRAPTSHFPPCGDWHPLVSRGLWQAVDYPGPEETERASKPGAGLVRDSGAAWLPLRHPSTHATQQRAETPKGRNFSSRLLPTSAADTTSG